jgi:hypothetical protein
MEQIFVESSKSYRHGFILKEQELRRFVDLMNEQFKKLSSTSVEYNFQIKYQNGAVANTKDIESVLKQENEGSSSIVRLAIGGRLREGEKESLIKIDFRNPDLTEDEIEVPIKHLIKGQSRDWVFVTSSLIEERIVKIKRSQLDPSASNGPTKFLYKMSAPIVMLILMIAMFSSIPESSDKLASAKNKVIEDIESKWKSKSITDPIDVIIRLEKEKKSRE